jgi:hypothetical protein
MLPPPHRRTLGAICRSTRPWFLALSGTEMFGRHGAESAPKQGSMNAGSPRHRRGRGAMTNRDRWWGGLGRSTVRSAVLLAALLAITAAPRASLADCCNCIDSRDFPTPTAFCAAGANLSLCGINAGGFNCQAQVVGGTCNPMDNRPDATCEPPSTPTAIPPPTEGVPAMSESGLLLMLALLATAGTLTLLGRRARRPPS